MYHLGRSEAQGHDDETVDTDPIPLTDALRQLDTHMPLAKFSSYSAKLTASGFYYAQSVVDSKGDPGVFVHHDGVGMPRGLVPTFLREMTKIVENAANAKRHRLEDISPVVVEDAE